MKEYQSAMKVIRVLNSAGYEAYLVGGCVRNFLMGLSPSDYDIATNAGVEEIEALFDFRVIGSGEKHGTVLVMLDGVDQKIEVTSYRDGAKTITDDLSHRDFTINAMAYHPAEGIVDPFKGRDDIKNRVIRGVNDPVMRFREDPLRILRALRFASVLGFRVDENTSQAVHEMSGLLESVAPERIREEMTKILCGSCAEYVMNEFADVFCAVIPEMKAMIGFEQHNSHHYLDVYAHTVKVVTSSPNTPALRWAALLHDIAKPECYFMGENGQGHFYGHDERGAEIAENIMNRLKFDGHTKSVVKFLIAAHCIHFPATRKTARRLLARYGSENVNMLLELQRADLAGHVFSEEIAEKYADAVRLIHEAEEENACMTVRDLAVNGYDMIAIGLEGAEIGRALTAILEAVVDERVINEREELMKFAKRYYNRDILSQKSHKEEKRRA